MTCFSSQWRYDRVERILRIAFVNLILFLCAYKLVLLVYFVHVVFIFVYDTHICSWNYCSCNQFLCIVCSKRQRIQTKIKLKFCCWVLLPISCHGIHQWLEWTRIAKTRLWEKWFSVMCHWWCLIDLRTCRVWWVILCVTVFDLVLQDIFNAAFFRILQTKSQNKGLRTFPGKSLSRKDDSRKDVSRKDVSRIVIFPERRFPERRFPDKMFPGQSLSWKDVSQKIIFTEEIVCHCFNVKQTLTVFCVNWRIIGYC